MVKLQDDLFDSSRAAELGRLLKENPDDLSEIWKRLKEDPSIATEIADASADGSRWAKWKNSEFFK